MRLTPILDFKHSLRDPKNIESNLKRRGSLSLDVDDLMEQWKVYSSIIAKKRAVESHQKQTMDLLEQSKKVKEEAAIRKYTLELETVQEDLHNFVTNLADFEKTFIDQFLSLPNELSTFTPDEVQIVSSFGERVVEKKGKQQAHHLAYEDSIDYHNQTNYFLKGDAAKFDHTFAHHCVDYFRKQKFVQFSNPDFIQTFLFDAFGISTENSYEVSQKSDDPTKSIYLVGNSSLQSFFGFIARLRVYGTLLPLQWVSMGKTYNCINRDECSLFNVSQSSVVQVFQAGTKEQMAHKFQETISLIFNLFKTLDIHFRIVYVPAKELSAAESLTAKIEMFSPHSGKYIEVGNLSHYSDYISKRMLFSYVIDRKSNAIDFPHILSGTVCNLTRIVAIILETHNGVIPHTLFKKIS